MTNYLLVGLGNVGAQYELTRHNAGFLALDHLASQYDAPFPIQPTRLAFLTDFRYKGRHLHLIKPTTFMNLSGRAVNYWLQELKIPVENLLVVTDDLALPFGKLRLRPKGAHGGHNGLRDIEAAVGTNGYARLRFGIGGDFLKGGQVDYVLSNFTPAEREALPPRLARASEVMRSFCTQGLELTMTQYNE